MSLQRRVHGPSDAVDVVEVVARLGERWYGQPVVVPAAAGTADVVVRIEPSWRPAIPAAVGRDPLGRDGGLVDAFELGNGTVRAATVDGAFRGLVALVRGQGPGLDGPRYAWRGLSVDVARHFFPVAELEALIDLLAFYGLNVLHVHLTDSQAWRVPIDGWPALTPDGESWYSRAELAGLVAYAADRRITVVPEIDMPGHSHAALRAYPELLGPEPPPHRFLGHLRPGIEPAMRFVDDVLGTLVQLSPSPFVHVGGDEAFGMDPAEYAEFIRIVRQRVRDRGAVPVAWQEASRSGSYGAGDVLQLWTAPGDLPTAGMIEQLIPERFAEIRPAFAASFAEAPGDAGRAIGAGTSILLSPSWPFYLDRRYGEPSLDAEQNTALQRLGNPGYPPRPMHEMWEWSPEGMLGDAVETAQTAGVEAAIWAETIDGIDDLATLLLPRLALLAEMMWSHDRRPFAHAAADAAQDAGVWERLGFGAYFRSRAVFGDNGVRT